MRQILIQDRQTRLFFGLDEGWTISPDSARNFETSLNAIVYCMEKGLAQAQVVVKFGTPGACDVVIPVARETDRFAA
jgi:hypothetical protein